MRKKYYLFLLTIYTIMLSGCGNDKNKDLTCTVTFDDNATHILSYSFEDGKTYLMDTTLITPIEQVADTELYGELFVNSINSITGCTGTFNIIDGMVYTNETCNLNEMSDEDIWSMYLTDRESLEHTRKEHVKHYENHKPPFFCE